MLYTQFVCKEHPDGNYIVRKKKSEDQEEEEKEVESGRQAGAGGGSSTWRAFGHPRFLAHILQ